MLYCFPLKNFKGQQICFLHNRSYSIVLYLYLNQPILCYFTYILCCCKYIYILCSAAGVKQFKG